MGELSQAGQTGGKQRGEGVGGGGGGTQESRGERIVF